MRTRCLVVLALSSLCAAPRVASAQEDAAVRAEAQALFDRASARMDEHDYATACPLLEQVLRLLPGKIGGLLTLGECYAGEGRLASAWATYRQAAHRATVAGDARAREAQQEADALEARLPRLRIQLDAGTKGLAGLEVKRDGAPVAAATWGAPVPVDPGEHVVEARAPDHEAFRVTVTVKEREHRDIAVALVPVAPAPAMPLRVPAGVPRETAEAPRDGEDQRRAGLVVGGLGVAALGVAGVLGIVTLVKAGGLPKCANTDAACIDDLRNPAIRSAERIQTAGFVMLGVGAAATATGITLFATAPKKVTVRASVAPGGVTLRGAW